MGRIPPTSPRENPTQAVEDHIINSSNHHSDIVLRYCNLQHVRRTSVTSYIFNILNHKITIIVHMTLQLRQSLSNTVKGQPTITIKVHGISVQQQVRLYSLIHLLSCSIV